MVGGFIVIFFLYLELERLIDDFQKQYLGSNFGPLRGPSDYF